LHNEEIQGLRLLGADESVANSHAATNKVDKGKESSQQYMFLVLDDSRLEHDVLAVCALLENTVL